ncbi:hypothetical protein KGP17_11870 [Serratia sp. JSRIV001]|uniref:hypothetical protein n=1 Tax=Serratia sp. JSRIV001 TaxID=2831893 RepID=UPI001CBE8D04|nr:hypothetical protein [Serratia sp. JSRIV001]UAN48168.1 hypothetical protein KGP17_11870 [Serratia sp. JSRIV001]
MIGFVLIAICIGLSIFCYKKGWINKLQIIQVVLYNFFGLVAIIYSIATIHELSGQGIKMWSATFLVLSSIVTVFVGILSIGWASLAFQKVQDKVISVKRLKCLNNYTVPVLFIVLLYIGNAFNSYADSMQAKELGFNSEKDFSEAKRNNIYNVDDYSKFALDKKVKEDTESLDKAEKNKIIEAERSAPQFNTKAYKELYPSYKHWDVSQAHNMFIDSVYGRGKLYMNTTGVDSNGNNFVYLLEFEGDKNKTFHVAMNEEEAKAHYKAITQVLRTVKNDSIEQTEVTTVHGQSSDYTYFYRYDISSKQLYMGICNASLECSSFDQKNATELANMVYSFFKPLADYYKN